MNKADEQRARLLLASMVRAPDASQLIREGSWAEINSDTALAAMIAFAAPPAPLPDEVAREIAADVMQWGAPHFRHMVSFNTLCEAIEGTLRRLATPSTDRGDSHDGA